MGTEDLTPELKEKIRACKTAEDLMTLAKQEGFELSDEQLESVSGGLQWLSTDHCPTDWDCIAD